jgi:acetylornithine deacetylase/succinyl-diaminopimelate desuccinylase-like protein
LANADKPLVFADYGHKIPNAKTVLFYIHFDGQPVIPAQWAQKSPFEAVLKQRNATGNRLTVTNC